MGLLLDLGYLIATVLTLPWFVYRVTVRGDWRSILLRLGATLPPPTDHSIWLHGSSAGEISLLQPLVQRLERDLPETPLLISAYSSTGFAAARKAYPNHRVIYFPADLSFVVRRFLRRFGPRLVVIVESDFWPNFLIATQARGVPVAVLNGKMSERSYRLHARTRLVPFLLKRAPVIAVQSDEFAKRLLDLGIPRNRIQVTGNMKYDLAASVDAAETKTALRSSLGYQSEDVVIIGGSLHGQENEILIDSFRRLREIDDNVALILVPRYPTDAQRVFNLLVESGFDVARKTSIDRGDRSAPGRAGVLIVDTVGELRALYGAADVAFVGGSLFFRSSNKGGHNLIEPAVLGVPVLFGPYNFSFKDTVKDLLDADAGVEVADGGALYTALKELTSDERQRNEMGSRARDVIVRERGVTERNYRLLVPLLEAVRRPPAPHRFSVWSVVVYLLLPYALFTLIRKGLSYPPYWHRWRERFGYATPITDQRTIWVHAVSVGEVRTASELIHSLSRRYPEYRILVTTATPTGSEQVRDLFGDRVSHAYVPYDLPTAVRRFMDRVNPHFAVIAETEFWPNLFGECRRRSIPLLLVNVRISRASSRGYRRFPRTTQRMLANAELLCAQTERDAQQLEQLGVARHLIHVTGNLKFDLPVRDTVRKEGAIIRDQWGRERFVLIAASTHKGEERDVLSAFSRLRGRHPDVLLVVVPRHPERFNTVARLCARAGWNVVRRSECDRELGSDVDVLVGDTMGELQVLYAASDFAFIGGSLVPIGGHNLLEACAVGVPVVFGPHMFHVEEISAMAVERGAGHAIGTVEELTETIREYIVRPEQRAAAAEAAMKLVADNRGSLERTLEHIERTLDIGNPEPGPQARPLTR